MKTKLDRLMNCIQEGEEIIKFVIPAEGEDKVPEALIRKPDGREVPLYYNEKAEAWQ